MDQPTFGRTVRDRRVRMGLSLGQLSRDLGITPQQLSDIEYHRAEPDRILRYDFARALDLDDDLLQSLPIGSPTLPLKEGTVIIVCRRRTSTDEEARR